MTDILADVRAWVLDVDGCLMRTSRAGGAGGQAMPGAQELVTALRYAQHTVLMCTNASQRPPRTYADHLRASGIDVADEMFVTAGSAAADYMSRHPYYLVPSEETQELEDSRFWFADTMHWSRGAHPFDSIGAEAVYLGAGQNSTRIFVLPAALGLDVRIMNGYVYICPIAVEDPAEIERRLALFQERAGYYQHGLPPWPTGRIQTVDVLKRLLTKVRKAAYGTNFEETEQGVSGLGVVIRDGLERSVAAFTVAIPTARFRRDSISDYVEVLWKGAAQASQRLRQRESGNLSL